MQHHTQNTLAHLSPLLHPQARRSALYSSPQGHLFQQLLDLLAFYCDFPMDDHTGEQLKEDDVTSRHYDKVGVVWWGGCAKSVRV
jgi:hypothetical protein